MSYISVTSVRAACGAPTALVTDTVITQFITEVENLTGKWLNAAFEPTRRIDILDGNGLPYFYAMKNPLLSVRKLTSDGTELTLSDLHIYKNSGKIALSGDSDLSSFVAESRSVICEYYHGWVEYSTTTTDTDTASTAGSSVALSVDSESGFSADDWIEIIGNDGYQESAKITATGTGEITVDILMYSHESGSIITKLQIPEYIKRFMELEAGICVAINAMGSTYTFNTSYTIGDFTTNLGVPYPHFQTQFTNMVKERDGLVRKLRPRMGIR
ncbi:MAG: hypothetical protein KAK00_00510 [Nanoarchaeota archaeon]|nr:hypothetical protein [Nanoarchaeota archaeon]